MVSPASPQDEWSPRSDDPLGPVPAGGPNPVAAGSGVWDEAVFSELPELTASDLRPAGQRRRVAMPLLLFLATCASTFWVGASGWQPIEAMGSWQRIAVTVAAHWAQGATYMFAIMAILITHEMGHFLFAVRYRIPASYPLFIPIPINPIGTMGAVIGMDGLRANRRQMFDIGIAGPLAGLVVAIPVVCLGIARLDLQANGPGELAFHNPLLVQLLIGWLRDDIAADATVGIGQLNPYFLAGWVGLLVTGLNMLPISQLDGGHVAYALFGKQAHTVARTFLVLAIAFLVIYIYDAYIWTMMLILVILIGTDHPPTADDSMPLGPVRWLIGTLALVIPILCFPLWGVTT